MNFEEAQQIVKENSLSWVLDEQTFHRLGDLQALVKASKGTDVFLAFFDIHPSFGDSLNFFALDEDAVPDLLRWANPELTRQVGIAEEQYIRDLGRHRMEHDEQITNLTKLILDLEGLAEAAKAHFGHYDKAWEEQYQRLRRQVRKLQEERAEAWEMERYMAKRNYEPFQIAEWVAQQPKEEGN